MIDISTLDEHELELYNSPDPADQLALKIRLKIKALGFDPDSQIEVIDSNNIEDPIIEETPIVFYIWERIKIDD